MIIDWFSTYCCGALRYFPRHNRVLPWFGNHYCKDRSMVQVTVKSLLTEPRLQKPGLSEMIKRKEEVK